jgi:hypothetical protein
MDGAAQQHFEALKVSNGKRSATSRLRKLRSSSSLMYQTQGHWEQHCAALTAVEQRRANRLCEAALTKAQKKLRHHAQKKVTGVQAVMEHYLYSNVCIVITDHQYRQHDEPNQST